MPVFSLIISPNHSTNRYVDGLKGGFSGPMAKLPGWMRPAVEVINEGQFGPSYARIAQFFNAKAAENAVM